MKFDAEPYLQRLKPFQRATVEHVFDRLFGPTDPVDRYLVADEVGLGKTMIARGLIAKMIEHYAATDPQRRIDVLYVCSNQAIAKQNFSKLAIVGNSQAAVTDRITKLPLHVRELKKKLPGLGMAVNFIPITPTTSLDLRSNVGRVDERALLWIMLADDRLLGRSFMSRRGPERLLQQNVSDWRWWEEKQIDPASIDPTLFKAFVRDAKAGSPSLLDEFREAADLFKDVRRWRDPDLKHLRTEVVGKLRRQLAKTCIAALEPDLIILDEFQRFPRLLDIEEGVGQLADLLFRQPDAKTLLLSATPYKMLTRSTELDEDHHSDFLVTTAFLLEHQEADVDRVAEALHAYRHELRAISRGGDAAGALVARDEVSRLLGRVMCRTERLAATADRNGMLDFHPADPVVPELTSGDLLQFRELDRIASVLKANDMVEYWKSVPFPLNFMDEYKLAKTFERELNSGSIGDFKHGLDTDGARELRKIDLGNARLRGLVNRLDEERAWKLLWLPPSLPYYAAGPPFDRATIKTKRLIFSAWTVVPKAIAAMTSFEAERNLFGSLEGGTRPEGQSLQWRPNGTMNEVALSLPSPYLADVGDPLMLASDSGGADGPVDRRRLLVGVQRRIAAELKKLPAQGPSRGRVDPQWYVVAPLLLDEQHEPGSAQVLLDAAEEVGSDAASWKSHRARLQDLVADPSTLGRRPADLAEQLAKMAVAAPGTAALRALRRGRAHELFAADIGPALEIGLAFRGLFNLPEAYAIVRALADTRYADDIFWKAALDYCVNGNLQAVLDEYVHAMSDWVEDRPTDEGGKTGAIVETVVEAIGIKTTDLTARTIKAGRLGEPLQMRSRFALRLGDGRTEDEKAVNRVDTVRKAFNSPFWPFVLATTSIGQEGLDFHHYSHAVLHWNLPSNPVDLEQREGRVHRFKNHAVRRNLAAQYRAEALQSDSPWEAMFEAAPSADEGLQPYWVFEGPARVERHALVMPMSRDAERLVELSRLLGIYRLAFGQPRQDELLAALHRDPTLEDRLHELLIDLSPEKLNAVAS